MVDREILYYKTNKNTYNFQNIQTIRIFRDIFNGTITTKEADHLLGEILNFKKQVKPKNTEKKQQKEDVLKNFYNFL